MELAISEWGDPAWADEVDRLRLLGSWVRRKRFEARLAAVEQALLYRGGQQGRGQEQVSPTEMLGLFGVTV